MGFVARLRPEVVHVAAPWRTFDQTIAGMVDSLAAAGMLPAGTEATAVQAVLVREGEAPTALLDIHAGVPHARFAGVHEPVVALALSPAGLYEAVPTVRIQIVALVLSPPDARGDHLELLASIAMLLRSPALRARLLAAADAAAALSALRHHART